MSTTKARSHLLSISLITLLAASFALTALAQEPKKIRRFGNPVTSFSDTPADSQESLQSQFVTYRSDLEAVLRMANWDGDPRDLFRAVEEGQAERVSVPVGETFHWMAFRKYKTLEYTENVQWAGKEPFSAWRVKVESNDKIHTFVIPEVCLNLALYGQEPIPPNPPTCSLSATVAGADATPCGKAAAVSLSGSTNGEKIAITDVGGGSTDGLSPAGTGRWNYAPTAAGSYTFTATATNKRGETTTCTATATVPAIVPCVECRLAASYDETTKTFTVDAGGSVGSVEITGITQPDGSGGDMSALTAAGDDRWTYAPKRRGRKPGGYTFSATASEAGETDSCSATATVPERVAEGDWILRVFGAVVDTDEDFRSASTLPNGSSLRDHLQVERGQGFGFGIERKFTPRLGLELSAIFADVDANFMRDIDTLWEMVSENPEFVPITLGLNLHLTPDRKVDFYLGPLIGVIQSNDEDFRVFGETVSGQIDDEFTFGAQIGLDVPATSKFAFTAGLRWLDASFELGDEEADEIELSLDPLVLMVGFAYHF